MSFLTDNTLRLLNLEDDIHALTQVAILVEVWPDLKQDLNLSNIDNVMAFLLETEHYLDQYASVIESYGLDGKSLLNVSEKLRSQYDDKLPPQLKKLLLPVSSFKESADKSNPGLVSWQLLKAGHEDTGTLGDTDMGFSIAASTQATVELEAGDDPDLDTADGLPLIRFGFSGNLAAGTELSSQWQLGALNVSFSSENNGRLDYWFECEKPEKMFARAAATCLSQLPSPFSLSSLWEAAEAQFQGLRLEFLTQATGAIDVTFADVRNNPWVDITSGFQLNTTYKRQYHYEMSVTRIADNAGALKIKLKRNRQKNYTRSASLGITLSLEKLVSHVRENLVLPHLNQYEEIVTAYREYLTPGTYLKQKINTIISDHIAELTTDQNVTELLRLLAGLDTDGQNPVKQLTDRLAAYLDNGAGVLSKSPQQLAEGILLSLEKELETSLSEKIRPALVQKLAEEIQELQSDFKAKLSSMAESELTELVDNLEALGGSIQQTMAEQSEKLNKAFAGLKKLFDKIDLKIRSISGAISESSQQKLAIRLLSQHQINTGAEAEVELSISALNDKTIDCYEKLTRGNLDAVVDLLGEPIEGVSVDKAAWTAFIQRHREEGIELAFFGLELGEKSILDSRVTVTRDSQGNVVITSHLSVNKILDGIKEKQSVGYFSPLSIHIARKTRFLPFSLTVSKEDERLELYELEDFLAGFVEAGLLSERIRLQALAIYGDWRNTPERKDIKARIDVLLPIADQALEALMNYGGQSSDAELIEDVLSALVEHDVYTDSELKSSIRALKIGRLKRYKTAQMMYANFNPSLKSHYRGEPGRVLFAREHFATTQENLPRRLSGSARERDGLAIHMYIKSFALLVRRLHQYGQPDYQPTQDMQDQENLLLGFCLQRWLKVKRAFLMHPSDEVAQATIAFLALIADAAGLPGHNQDSPMLLTLAVEGDSPIILG